MAARPRMHSAHETRDLFVRRMRLHCAAVSCAPHVICFILLLFLLHIIVLHITHDGGGVELRSNSASVTPSFFCLDFSFSGPTPHMHGIHFGLNSYGFATVPSATAMGYGTRCAAVTLLRHHL